MRASLSSDHAGLAAGHQRGAEPAPTGRGWRRFRDDAVPFSSGTASSRARRARSVTSVEVGYEGRASSQASALIRHAFATRTSWMDFAPRPWREVPRSVHDLV